MLSNKGKQDLMVFIIIITCISIFSAFISIIIPIVLIIASCGLVLFLRYKTLQAIEKQKELEKRMKELHKEKNGEILFLTEDEMEQLRVYGATIHNNKHITMNEMEIIK